MRTKSPKKPTTINWQKLALALGGDDQQQDQAGHPGTQWAQQNEDRPSIARALNIPAAVWTCRTRSKRIVARDARRLQRAVDSLDHLPDEAETTHIVTGAEFRGFDLLPAMLKLSGAKSFDSLTATTLGFSRDNLQDLAGMVQAGAIPADKLRILCSDFFRRADSAIWDAGQEQAGRLGYGFRSTRNHTKLILAAIAGRYYVTESSANLRSCSNLEQFSMTQSRELFEFHQGWIQQVWETAED